VATGLFFERLVMMQLIGMLGAPGHALQIGVLAGLGGFGLRDHAVAALSNRSVL
jgi:hypothetical protein